MRVEGERSTDIAVVWNDLRAFHAPVVRSDGFAGQVTETGNPAPASSHGSPTDP